MRKVREVLRLKYVSGASVRTIARSVGIGRTTVAEYLRRAAVIGITWPVPAEIDDAELERRLFITAGFYKSPTRAIPDWQHVHSELRRRGVTLLLLWEEYRADRLQPVLRSVHRVAPGRQRDDAPDPCRRREAVRRLRRRHRAGV
jgi:transposase